MKNYKKKLYEIIKLFNHIYFLRYDENEIDEIVDEIINNMNNNYNDDIFYNSIINFMKKNNYNILNHYDEFNNDDLKYLLKCHEIEI